ERHRRTEERYATLIHGLLVSKRFSVAVWREGDDAGCVSVSIKKRPVELRDFGLSGEMLQQVSVPVVCEQGEALRQRALRRLREAHATFREEEVPRRPKRVEPAADLSKEGATKGNLHFDTCHVSG